MKQRTPVERTHYSVDDLAEKWGMSTKWVRRRIWSGEIKAVRFGAIVKVPLAEIHRFEATRPRVA